MAYGTETEIKGIKKAIDLLLEKQEFLSEELGIASGNQKFSLKKQLQQLETELETYRQKIQKLKEENSSTSDLKGLDNKTQKAHEEMKENLKEEEIAPKEKKKINIFVSYSSKDRDLREILQSHLIHRKDFEYLQWTDTQIDLGADWKSTIEKALKGSNIAILLVSSNFASSSFINQNELTEFFERQQKLFNSSCFG
ncbi:TIR domain-containing protein [Bernardetia litoralis DSM 6794]|uniref:TIR domain-containing protein n=1 Tax=Bernardetia litoralis (strain ATCC 23117 / DSM 6794 / NBRC 15988 / NCIMB 1366 / Fx l1 / Sio-4) TaxID=880071 RepID=I4AGU3_BERLS|nr:toll/interleukin-1 receptor domain-containing protein [Bernardetia litoralis]AFM03178.1 TIR domain-containing protein [Bernardetia litoralis DSM 6794]